MADTLATLCDICGIEPPASNEGTSFLPVLRGTQETIRDVLYGVYSGGRAAHRLSLGVELLLAEIEAEGPNWWRSEPMNGLRRPAKDKQPAAGRD